MAEGEGGSPGEGPGGPGGRGARGSRLLAGHCSVRLPPLSREGQARPCPLRVGRAAPEVSGRWRDRGRTPRAGPAWRGRLWLSGGAAGWPRAVGAGRDVPPSRARRPWVRRGCRGSRPVLGAHPGVVRGSSRRALPRAEAFPGAGRCRCCSLPVTCAGVLLSGWGEICRAPGALLFCLKAVNYAIQINLI